METNAPEKLEPAASIIDRFGGPEAVQEITGADRTRVYRWTQSKEKGGTDGFIPLKPAQKLWAYAKANGIEIPGDMFLSAKSGAEVAA
ncbi:hypothetical protein FBZ98_1011007 [Rhizobium sp. ERR 922]|uniref:hypothetical protein n=1 Tax=unclassified Rhizobium TaxID=2613769 RepID=UPI0011AD36C7|nr:MULTISPECIES: hypothetical protein [unclassified Rhizobium]TWB61662.1 hypothetical protein FBZ98_1011007 [Rhizobium sp. ERR 922]TWC04588.1 hypothetical protein FBZ97_1011007 [Rhizobium sp. ERR 942]